MTCYRATLEYLYFRFRKAWTPGEEVSIDEGLIAFQGQAHFRYVFYYFCILHIFYSKFVLKLYINLF